MTFYVYFLSKVGDKIYDLAAWAGSNSGMLEALSSSMNVVCVSSTQSNELTGVTSLIELLPLCLRPPVFVKDKLHAHYMCVCTVHTVAMLCHKPVLYYNFLLIDDDQLEPRAPGFHLTVCDEDVERCHRYRIKLE